MMILTRISKSEVKFISSDSKEFLKLVQRLTFFVEGAIFSQKYKDGIWDGRVRFFKDKNVFQIGLLKFVCEVLDNEGIEYRMEDFIQYSSAINISDVKLTDGLRPQQISGVRAFFRNPFGIMAIPTRGGKTFTAAECIRIAKLKGFNTSLFFVDGIDLFKQTVDEIANFLKIDKNEIGQLQGEGVYDFKDINVAMIQSFTRILSPKKTKKDGDSERSKTSSENDIDGIKKRKLERLIMDIKFLIVDEVQEYYSENRLSTIKKFRNSDLILSLSATPFKSEDMIGSLKMRCVVGDTIYETTESELIDNGSLVKNYVFIIIFGEGQYEKSKTNYNDYLTKHVIENESRNSLISDIILILDEKRLKTLVMVNKKKHGNILSQKTGFTFVSGDDKDEDRERIKSEFLAQDSGVLLASDIYKKGVSLNNCEVMINVSGGLEQSAIIQKRGRVLASSTGKTAAIIIDIFDAKQYLKDHSLSRLEIYEKKIGSDNIIVLDSADKDFFSDLSDIVEDIFYGKES